MKRLRKGLAVAAMALVVGPLAAGCGGSGPVSGAVKSAISSLTSSRTASLPSRSASIAPPTPTAEAPATGQAPENPAAASPAAGGSGSSLLWLWIVLAAVVVIVVAVLIARRSGRRSAQAANWRSRAADARARGSALYDAMSMADRREGWAAGEAGARWADIQRRADDLAQALYELRESAPGELERASADDALTSLHAVRSAMDAERTPGAGSREGARAHDLLLSFGASLRALRPRDDYGP